MNLVLEDVTALERAMHALDAAEEELSVAKGSYDEKRQRAVDRIKKEIDSSMMPENAIRELVRIRFLLKDSLRGERERCIEARERLERVLGELDSAWRTLA